MSDDDNGSEYKTEKCRKQSALGKNLTVLHCVAQERYIMAGRKM